MSENLKFTWDANLQAAEAKDVDGSLPISGELVNGEVCANNFALDAAELPNVATQVKDLTLRIDHSKSVRDVIGGLKIGKYDEKTKRVMFEAEVDDPAIQRSILKGRLKYVSIGATADSFCSGCAKPTRPFKACKCKGAHEIIKNIKLKEASIVTDPAYKTSTFSASIEAALSENIVTPKSSNEDEVRPLGNIKLGENKMSEEIKATTVKPAGTDAVVLMAEKLESLSAAFSKMEARFKKEEEDEAKKKKEAEAVKSEAAYAKLEALAVKLEEFMKPKKEETSTGIPKDVPKFEEKAKKPVEDDEEETEEPVKKAKKEAKGSKVEDASGTSATITADAVPTWFKEIRAFAEEHGILE